MLKYLSLFLLFVVSWHCRADFKVNAMAPLIVNDKEQFRHQLAVAKKLGVSGVSVDVWWGKVEGQADQQFDWRYYDEIFSLIVDADLNLIPIMSFHQCGGNVGDNCNIPIPNWIWQHFSAQGIKPTDLQYKSEFNHYSQETVSLWADKYALNQYQEFLQAFTHRFADIAPYVAEVNISMGAAGELRFPSYNSHDGDAAQFPSRGSFQAYSTLAISDFQRVLKQRYGDIANLNQEWHSNYKAFGDILPPSQFSEFIERGEHLKTRYGQDFIDWYNNSLVQHGKRMLKMADEALTETFSSVPLGFKIPGIHWKIATTGNDARSAELAAGLLDSQQPYDESNGFGYQSIIAVAHSLPNSKRSVVLHFTALEMSDNPQHPSQSMAKTLVHWIGAEAKRQGVTLMGENALAGGVMHDAGWNNIADAVSTGSYAGLTVLRLQQITDTQAGRRGVRRLLTPKVSKLPLHPRAEKMVFQPE